MREHIGHLYLALGRHSDALTEFRAAIANNLAERKSTLEVEEQIARLEAMLGER